LDGLQETLEILRDTELVQRLVEAEAELAVGGGHSLEEVRKDYREAHTETRGDRSR
jgi:hypothetical protein